MQLKLIFSGIALAATLVGDLSQAAAKYSETTTYRSEQVYRAALRFLRVVKHFDVVEKDEQTGYLLFQYQAPGAKKTTPGAIEVIDSSEGTRLIVRLNSYPSYHEAHLADEVLKKLKDDYGAPPIRKKSPARKKSAEESSEKEDETKESSSESSPQSPDPRKTKQRAGASPPGE
ncbi:MAG: hypothetical protein MK135_07020 [Polyangiaceae bacterium]|nr:hypothetical protein [Polyangiaceae bacterium]